MTHRPSRLTQSGHENCRCTAAHRAVRAHDAGQRAAGGAGYSGADLGDAHRISGIYARRIDRAQGRMALIFGERQANPLPWRPPLEQFAGREVAGVLRQQSLSRRLQR